MSVERMVLSSGQKIFLNGTEYEIICVRGDGTSSIVYDAKTYIELLKRYRNVLIKELYPANLNIRRNAANALVIPKDSADLFDKYKASFKMAAGLQLEFHNPSEEADNTASSTNSTSSLEYVYECGNTLYSVMTLEDGQTYEEYNSNDLRSHIEICKNLAIAIGRYHERGYLHLDIKPENIFVLEGSNQIKLFDFDTFQLKENIQNRNCRVSYTEAFAPPELQLIKVDNDYYSQIDKRTDIYMIGATLLYKLFGRTPSPMDKLSFQRWDFKMSIIAKDTSPQVRDALTAVLRKTLARKKNDRYNNTSDLIKALEEILYLLNFDYYLIPKSVYKTTPDANYIRREDKLNQINDTLSKKHMVFLYGMGGIGKSETARSYAQEYSSDYSVIQLVGYHSNLAETINSLVFSDDNKSRTDKQSKEERFDLVYNRLQSKLLNNNKTLLIIDNYNYNSDVDSEDNLKILSKLRELHIHFVFTTRNKPFDESEAVIIDELSTEKLKQLFFSINPNREKDLERIKNVEKIIELTGHHTLTVDLIARQSLSIENSGKHTIDKLIDEISSCGLNNKASVKVKNKKDGLERNARVYDQIKALFDFASLSETEKFVIAAASLLPITGMNEKDFCELIELEKVSGVSCWGEHESITTLVDNGWLKRSVHIKFDDEFLDKNPGFATLLELGALDNKSKTFISIHPIIADVAINELGFPFECFQYLYNNLECCIKQRWDLFFENAHIHSFLHSPEWIGLSPYDNILINIIHVVPLCHDNFVYISKLANHLILYHLVSDFDIYLKKAKDYLNGCMDSVLCDLAWYYKELCMRNCVYRLPQKVVPTEYTNNKKENIKYNDKAKEYASLSFGLFDRILDYIDIAYLAGEFAAAFWYSHDFNTAFKYCKKYINYCRKANNSVELSIALFIIGNYYFQYSFEIDSEEERIRYLNYSKKIIESAINLYCQLPQLNQEKLKIWNGTLNQVVSYLNNPYTNYGAIKSDHLYIKGYRTALLTNFQKRLTNPQSKTNSAGIVMVSHKSTEQNYRLEMASFGSGDDIVNTLVFATIECIKRRILPGKENAEQFVCEFMEFFESVINRELLEDEPKDDEDEDDE